MEQVGVVNVDVVIVGVVIRWGRVGEPGQNSMKGPFSILDNAEKEFVKKFKDKTKNNWSERDNFTAMAGKYTLLEMDDDEGEEETDGPMVWEGGREGERVIINLFNNT